ncbi:MAG TPA: hypothetical protein VMH90_04700 [Thermoplasmata archaeon]|nr:hypothetical protein [Thermoplasmata archaeon]
MVATPSIATEFPALPEWDVASALIPRAGIARPIGPEFRPGRIGGPRPDDRIFPEAPMIYPWLEEAFRPGCATALVGPRALVPRFLPFLMASVVATGNEISLREGANRFSPYAVAAMGRHLGVAANDALARIRLARAFTAYQMVSLVEGWVDTLAAADPMPALLIASDPGALFEAEEVTPEERAALLRHVAGRLKRLAKATDRPLLVTHEGASLDLPGWAEEGPRLHETLRLSPGPAGTTFLLAERRAASVELVAAPTLQHRLEEFAGPAEPATAGWEGAPWAGPYPHTVMH